MIEKSFISKLIILFLVFGLCTAFVFAQSGSKKDVLALSYPMDKEVKVPFRSNGGYAGLKALAKIKREPKKGTKINIEASNLPQVFDFGSIYTTYILWAIGTDGSISRLGEMKSKSKGTTSGKLEVNTPLETFALIITAEPHQKVHKPSNKMILENLTPAEASKNLISSLSITYSYNDSDYFRDENVEDTKSKEYRKIPLSVLGARQAVRLASYAGAEFNAVEEFKKANAKLEELNNALTQKQKEKQIDYLAEQTMDLAVDAEKKAEETRKEKTEINKKNVLNQELEDAKGDINYFKNKANETEEKYEKEKRDREKCEQNNIRIKDNLTDERQAKVSAEEQLKIARDTINEQNKLIARLEERIELNQTIPELKQFFATIGTLKSTDPRIITVVLPETIWLSPESDEFSESAIERLVSFFKKIGDQKDCTTCKVEIAVYTDSNLDEAELIALKEDRAKALATEIIRAGMDKNKVKFEGLGSSTSTTVQKGQNRYKNRRTEVTLKF